MSESVSILPFVCKWLDTHSVPQYFETKEKLRNHIVQHVQHINSCKSSISGDSNYICLWEGCNKYKSSIIKLEEHLRRHAQQKPFKCPICNHSRFGSSGALSQHLITVHNGNVDTDDNDTLSDEDEELNLGKAKDKDDVRERKEIIPTSSTMKLSYRDALVKGSVNKNKNTEEKVNSYEYKKADEEVNHYAVWNLMCKGLEVLSSMPPESPTSEHDLDSDYYDDLPIAVKVKLTEAEQDKLMWDTFLDTYKDTEAGKYFNKASEMMKNIK